MHPDIDRSWIYVPFTISSILVVYSNLRAKSKVIDARWRLCAKFENGLIIFL